jgi:hypothetical protein
LCCVGTSALTLFQVLQRPSGDTHAIQGILQSLEPCATARDTVGPSFDLEHSNFSYHYATARYPMLWARCRSKTPSLKGLRPLEAFILRRALPLRCESLASNYLLWILTNGSPWHFHLLQEKLREDESRRADPLPLEFVCIL